jgi:hypothetical protein
LSESTPLSDLETTLSTKKKGMVAMSYAIVGCDGAVTSKGSSKAMPVDIPEGCRISYTENIAIVRPYSVRPKVFDDGHGNIAVVRITNKGDMVWVDVVAEERKFVPNLQKVVDYVGKETKSHRWLKIFLPTYDTHSNND